MGANWWPVAGPLFAAVAIVVSVIQDLGLRARLGAAFGIFMAIMFGGSALLTAMRTNLPGGVAICAAVFCFQIWLIVRRIVRWQSNRNSR